MTLSGTAFDRACGELLAMVERDYRPDLLVGIRTGGFAVAQSMARASAGRLTVAAVTCQRAGTRTKRQFLRWAPGLSRLPRALAGAFRKAELRLISRWRRARGPAQPVDAAEVAAIAARVSAAPQPMQLLVVDDAVDTGVTLASVMNALRKACPGACLRSAVLTVTLRAPLLEPDFALFQGVICRFPWSLDAAR